jgi:hypothetical protein
MIVTVTFYHCCLVHCLFLLRSASVQYALFLPVWIAGHFLFSLLLGPNNFARYKSCVLGEILHFALIIFYGIYLIFLTGNVSLSNYTFTNFVQRIDLFLRWTMLSHCMRHCLISVENFGRSEVDAIIAALSRWFALIVYMIDCSQVFICLFADVCLRLCMCRCTLSMISIIII